MRERGGVRWWCWCLGSECGQHFNKRSKENQKQENRNATRFKTRANRKRKPQRKRARGKLQFYESFACKCVCVTSQKYRKKNQKNNNNLRLLHNSWKCENFAKNENQNWKNSWKRTKSCLIHETSLLTLNVIYTQLYKAVIYNWNQHNIYTIYIFNTRER